MANRRERKTDHGISDFDALLRAIKAIKTQKESIRKAAHAYNINRTSLGRYLDKFNKEVPDISKLSDDKLLTILRRIGSYATTKQVFDEEQEEALVRYLVRCCHLYYGLSITELKQLAYEYARKLNIEYPTNWDNDQMAGKAWYYGFMLRHPSLSLRTPEQTSINRVRSFCKENVERFFEHYQGLMDIHHFDANQIWNMDETGFSTVPAKIGKVIGLKGLKRIGQVAAAERGTLVSMALAVNAAGNSVPPYYIFPRKNMQSYFMDSAPAGADATCTESGYMKQTEFVKYMRHFIKHTHPSREKPVLLLLDNHTSHLSIEAIDLALDNGVVMLTFPPHCSHKMQPLDVSVYGPVKTYYSNECTGWQKSNAGKVLDIRHIPGLSGNALDQALTPKNIKAGFAATGIFPLNKNAFTDADFVLADQSDQRQLATSFERNMTEEEQRRICVLTGQLEVAEEIEVETSEPSTSAGPSTAPSAGPPSTISRSESLSSVLSEIGPVQQVTPQKKSNRGRKPMVSTVLTSPESVATLKDRKEKSDAAKKKKEDSAKKRKGSPQKETPKKRTQPSRAAAAKKKSSSTSDEDVDFCMICMQNLPAKLTSANSIECNKCKRPFHLKCVHLTRSYFTCQNCDSDADLSE